MATGKWNIEVEGKEVEVMLSSADYFFSNTKALLTKMALFSKFKILKRTAKGADYEEKAFSPYSENYKLFRQDKGRPTAKVDLFFTGKMLGSMSVKANSLRSILYFSGREQALKASGLNYGNKYIKNRREFFALSKKDKDLLNTMAENELDKAGL